MTAQAGTESTVIELPGARNTFLMVLMAIAAGLVGTITVLILRGQLPIYMVAMLLVVAAGCIAMLAVILDQFVGAKLTVTDDTIAVSRLIGGDVYPWHRIEEIKVIAPTNSLGDDPFAEQTKRLGLGLFLSDSKRIRDTSLDADVVLCAVPEQRVELLISLVERLNRMRPKSGFRPAGPAAPPKIGAKKGDFRQRGAKIAAR